MTGNLTVEQELPSNMAIMVSGVTTDSTTLFNPRMPDSYVGALPQNAPYSAITPGLGPMELFYNQGVVHYLSLQTQLRNVSPSHGMQFQVNYNWSKDLTNNDDIFSTNKYGAGALNDPTCLSCEYARSAINVTQKLEANYIYALPDNWGRVPKRISHGWETLGIFNIQSGFPFTIQASYGTLQYGNSRNSGFGHSMRPFFIQQAPRDPHHRAQYFTNAVIGGTAEGYNTGYWAEPTTISPVPGIGTVLTSPGNLGRNTYTSPSWWNLDASMIKDTPITKTTMLQLRAEFFNVLNHPTFGFPGTDIQSSGFGMITSTQSSERQMQFGARFVF